MQRSQPLFLFLMSGDDFGNHAVDRLLQQLAAEARRTPRTDGAAVPNETPPGSTDQRLPARSEERQVDDESVEGRGAAESGEADDEPAVAPVASEGQMQTATSDVVPAEKIESWERLVARSQAAVHDEHTPIPGTRALAPEAGAARAGRSRRSIRWDVWFGTAFVVIGLLAVMYGVLYL